MADLTLDERAAMDELFPSLPPYELVPDKIALVIVDMQYLDAHPDYGLGRRARELGIAHLLEPYFDRCTAVTSNIQRLLATCRVGGIEVIHVVIATYTEDARECGEVARLLGIRPPKGSRETEILDELAPLDDEIVLPKITSSAFNSTPIDQILHNLGKDTLLLCGVVTNGCIETTARDARDLGYKVVLVSDACTAMSVEAHEYAIRFLSRTRGNARTTQDILDTLAQQTTSSAPRRLTPLPLGS